MVHKEEEAILAGHFSPTGISDLNISLNRFLLSDLKQILYRGPYAKASTQFSGMMNATTLFRGSFKHPNIVIDMYADDVRAIDSVQNKRNILGKIDSHISYFEYVSWIGREICRPVKRPTSSTRLAAYWITAI